MSGISWKKLLSVLLALVVGFIYIISLPEFSQYNAAPLPMRIKGLENPPFATQLNDNELSLGSISQHEKTVEAKATSIVRGDSTLLLQDKSVDYIYQRQYRRTMEGRMEKIAAERRPHRLPQVLVIGAKKCGTGTLKFFLSKHPDLAVETHEVHYFDIEDNYRRGAGWYRSKQTGSLPHQLVVEGSPAYFTTQNVPERVRAMNSSMKLILVLRDPVVRLISDYAHEKLMGHGQAERFRVSVPRRRYEEIVAGLKPGQFPTFDSVMLTPNGKVDTSLKLVQTGMYATHLRHWLQYFKETQIHIIDGHRFSKQPWVELEAVERFLNIKPHLTQDNFQFIPSKGFYCVRTSKTWPVCMNKGKGQEHPSVSNETLEKLKEFYRPYNEDFYKLVNVDFNW